MISYAPLWKTMQERGVTTYALLKNHGFSRGTLDSLKQGRNVTIATIDTLCGILDCKVEDILVYHKEKE